MKKTLAELIDELSIINIKVFFLIEKVQNKTATLEEAEKIQTLNKQRSKIMNAISEEFKQDERIKI